MGTHGPRIIVVEDHDDSRDLLLAVARLSADEADAIAVATLEDPRRAILEIRPALVSTAYELPDGNGLELLRWIRSHPDGHDLAVVLNSAHRGGARLRAAAAVCGPRSCQSP